MTMGLIGVGNMGGGVASTIFRPGYDLTVYEFIQASCDFVAGGRAKWADTPQTLAECSDLIFTSLPGRREVEVVALGEKAIVEESMMPAMGD